MKTGSFKHLIKLSLIGTSLVLAARLSSAETANQAQAPSNSVVPAPTYGPKDDALCDCKANPDQVKKESMNTVGVKGVDSTSQVQIDYELHHTKRTNIAIQSTFTLGISTSLQQSYVGSPVLRVALDF